MKTTNGKKVSKKQIRLASSNFLYNDNLVKAYRKLVKKLAQGKKHDLAADYVKVPENLDATSVKDMVDMIESAIQPESSHFELLENMVFNIYKNIGIDRPENHDEIVEFIINDVNDTADPENWHSGDVAIAFRRWIESKAMYKD